MKRITFNKGYFALTILFFFIEFLIGTYTHDSFVRPYVGDFFIVIFLYCFLKSFLNIANIPVAIAVLLIAYLAEWLQYLNILDTLGLRQSTIANVLLGNWFEWSDILAYTLGVITLIGFEKFRKNN